MIGKVTNANAKQPRCVMKLEGLEFSVDEIKTIKYIPNELLRTAFQKLKYIIINKQNKNK